MKKLIIAATVTILVILIAALLATGFFGNFMPNEPSPSPTPTLNVTPTPIPTTTPSNTPTPTPVINKDTIIVPDDYPTISSAIANATDGKTILVKNGVYTEPLLNITKSLTIMSQNQNGAEIIIHPPLIYTPALGAGTGMYEYINPIKVDSDNVTLSGFLVSCDGGSIVATGNGIKFLSNNMKGNASISISLNGDESEVKENSLEYLNLEGNKNQIKNNQVTSITSKGNNNTISSNQISVQSDYPFAGLDSNGNFNIIWSNRITGTYNAGHYSRGLNLNGNFNIVWNNSINGYYGLVVGYEGYNNYECKHNFLGGNTISGIGTDTGVGLDVIFGAYNVFYGNIITNCKDGVATGWNLVESNLFLENSFLRNGQNANNLNESHITQKYDSFFDNGVVGNYWDDYSGNGTYYVYNNTFDNFPLAESPGRLLDIPAFPSPWNSTTWVI